MRRAGPRPLAHALGAALDGASPQTTLARVQVHWPAAAGAVVAQEAEPVSERGGVLTLSCRSAAWAHELDLLAPDLLDRLNRALSPTATPLLTELRTRVSAGR